MLLSALAYALKLCNIFYDPFVSYIYLHKLHKRALPSKFCTYRHCLLLHKVFNNSIPRNDWLNLNFQIITTSRQTTFEVQNRSTYKVGNNFLSNRLACINKKIPLNMLNLDIGPYKVNCKNMFLIWIPCNLYWSLLLFYYALLFYFILIHTVPRSSNNDI